MPVDYETLMNIKQRLADSKLAEDKYKQDKLKAQGDFDTQMAFATAAEALNTPSAYAIRKGIQTRGPDYKSMIGAGPTEVEAPAEKYKDVLNQYYTAIGKQAESQDDRDFQMKKQYAQNQFDMNKLAQESMYKQQLAGLDNKNKKTEGGFERDLYVPGLGEALTKEDAKVLKDGSETLSNIENTINRMKEIRLGNKDKGTSGVGFEMFPTESSRSGKQLATDLKLQIKSLAQLGVLSKTDEEILANMVPEDPTSFRDPTPLLDQLAALSKEKFNTKISNRIYKPESAMAKTPGKTMETADNQGPTLEELMAERKARALKAR